MKKRFRYFPFLLLFMLGSCSKESIQSGKLRGDLIETSPKGSLSKNEILERIDELPATAFAHYGVTYHSITYRTEYQGKQIDSRGLLILPQGVDSIYLVTYLHGTEIPSPLIGVEKITPSLYDGSKETHRDVRNMGLSWATAGYAVFIPDYIGFGLTLGKDHPYVYYPEMFKSNIDGLLAVKHFLHDKGLHYDNRLFITGWSQGAGASLSAHKYIQESYAGDFTVVASSGLAGPYNFTGFTDDILSRKSEEVIVLPILSWAIYSLNKFSSLKRPTDQIYTFPVYDQMSALFPPSKKPEQIFNGYFLGKIIDGTDVAFRQEMKNNSFHEGWHPVGKVFLHHGDADNVVPYFNSVDALNGLTTAGGDVKLYTYPGGKHDTELGNFILTTLNDFNLLK